MKRRIIYLFYIGFLFTISHSYAQNIRVEGKIIKDYGLTFEVINPDVETAVDGELKLILDISKTADQKDQLNKYIETAARFLNMHANAGMTADQLKVAMTIHASAWKDILTDEAYEMRFGTKNPNSGLIKALTNAGVDVILCGQTASFREIKEDEILPEVKKALSAMTALIQYQNNGYRFIKF